jgi:ribose transport system substrate-binding protein
MKNRTPPTRRRVLRLALGVVGLLQLAGISTAWGADDADRFRGLIDPIKASKPYKIGVTLVHLHDDFWKGIAYGIADEAKEAGVEVVQISVAGAYGNVREQFAQLETLQTLGVDVAVVGAAAFDGYNGILRTLKDSGMTVVAAGIPVNSNSVDFGVTQDDTAIGVALADVVCKAKRAKDALAVTIPGPAGAEWARLRHVGFVEHAKGCSGLKVVEGAVGGNVGLEHGVSQASDLLLKNPDAGFIFTPEISLGMGAAQGARQVGSDAKVVSSSVVREAIPMIENGRLIAVVSEPGIVIGRLIVQYAVRKLDGKPMPNLVSEGSPYPNVIVPTTLITPENTRTYPFDLWEFPPKDWSIQAFQ